MWRLALNPKKYQYNLPRGASIRSAALWAVLPNVCDGRKQEACPKAGFAFRCAKGYNESRKNCKI